MEIDLELYRPDVWTGSEESGIRLSVIDVEPEHAQRTLVFLHGFGGWATQWRRQLRFFAGATLTLPASGGGSGAQK